MADQPVDQRDYWNRNLDPHNLGGEFEAGRFDLQEEIAFYLTPDQCAALREMEPLAGKLVLEVGAGIGTNSLYLAQQGARVVAIDIAPERLRTLRKLWQFAGGRGPEEAAPIFPIQCSADALPFRGDLFHHAYSRSVLIHTDLEKSVPELERVLRPAGTGIFIEPMTRNPLVNLYRRTLAPKEWRLITRYFAEPEFGIFTRTFARFRLQHFYVLSFLAFAWQFAFRSPRLFRASLSLLTAVDGLLTKGCPSLKRYAWFALIRVEKASSPLGKHAGEAQL